MPFNDDPRRQLPPSPFTAMVDEYRRQPTPVSPAQFLQAPAAPFQAEDTAAQLPQAPPRPKGSLFDKEHRQDTLLAIGTGLLGGFNFSDGLAAAGQNVMGLKKQLREENKVQTEYGGPDNSFEITIDPQTGVRSAKPVPVFQDYLEGKRTKAKDVADINGRAMFALQTLPAEQRPAAYAQMLANPQHYGINPETMPAQYDPVYATTAAGMGQTVAQATAAQRAAQSQENLQDYREGIQADRQVRTGIYQQRSAATTAQGAARVGQGAERLKLSRAAAARSASGGSGRGRAPKGRNPANNDLSYIN